MPPVALAAAFLVALAVGIAIVPLVRTLAIERELLDEPGGRKVHATAVPRLGGVAMLTAFLFAIGASLGLAGPPLPGFPRLVALVVGVVGVSTLGLIDDVRPLKANRKLLGQLLVASVAVALGLRVSVLSTPFGTLDLGFAGALITIAWLVGIVNAVNLVDGLDGLAGSVSLTVMVAYLLIAATVGATLPALVMGAGAGAVLAFLVYNRPPASIIMGDSGSMFLGFLLAGTAVWLLVEAPFRVSAAGLVLALGVPIADTAYAVVRRLLAGQSVFTPDSRHIHHQLVASGSAVPFVVLVLAGASAVLGLLAVVLSR